ncbi:MAG: hypothetical protein NTV60_00700 [Candidatus Kaiserbacteria bacterium]|nr:hypothetical protein [Candidatus Kaiserbacteria bacterium]
MKDRVNTYFAMLFMTIAAAGAASIIVHIAYADFSNFQGSEAQYAKLQKSILRK